MKKITAFVQARREKGTLSGRSGVWEKNLETTWGDRLCVHVFLRNCNYNLEVLPGLLSAYFEKGEEFCPLKDDRDVLLEKIEHSDGVIFCHSELRLSGFSTHLCRTFWTGSLFIYHRPRFFDKTATAIVTQTIPVGDNIRKYL